MFHILEDFDDFSDKNVLVGLSGGINSAAVLCWLAAMPEEAKPKELHLFYNMDGRDFLRVKEHFPDKYEAAEETSKKIGQYFGREEGYPGCSICSF